MGLVSRKVKADKFIVYVNKCDQRVDKSSAKEYLNTTLGDVAEQSCVFKELTEDSIYFARQY